MCRCENKNFRNNKLLSAFISYFSASNSEMKWVFGEGGNAGKKTVSFRNFFLFQSNSKHGKCLHKIQMNKCVENFYEFTLELFGKVFSNQWTLKKVLIFKGNLVETFTEVENVWWKFMKCCEWFYGGDKGGGGRESDENFWLIFNIWSKHVVWKNVSWIIIQNIWPHFISFVDTLRNTSQKWLFLSIFLASILEGIDRRLEMGPSSEL
jgi:hypothetical protein